MASRILQTGNAAIVRTPNTKALSVPSNPPVAAKALPRADSEGDAQLRPKVIPMVYGVPDVVG